MNQRRQHLRQTLEVRLSQRLALTPSLLQKIELLQLNKMELQEMLNQEMMENPILEEVVEPEPPAAPGEDTPAEDTPAEENSETAEKSEDERDSFDEIDFRYFFDEYLDTGYRNREFEDNEKPSFETFLVRPSSLSDHLTWQLGLLEIEPKTEQIARQIIGNLDEDGYLTLAIEELSELCSCSVEEAEVALRAVQGLEPLGVAARDLRECLSLQLVAMDLTDSLAARIIRDHLQLLEGHKFKEIASKTEVTFEEVLHSVEMIRRLIPKPGQRYNPQNATYVQPEVTIAKVNDEFVILQNDEGMPQLRLNAGYKALLKSNVTGQTKSFLKEKFRSAVDLLRSVSQRKQTIYKVCVCIVNRQREFLEQGPAALHPMLIKDVASELGVHSSTISRVVTNKYVDTPQGVIELRKFFTMGVGNSDGEELSITQVKLKIKRFIENENKKKPYSDNQIAQLLKGEDVFVTRRTVAKYREQMQVPGSRERKISYLF